MEPRQFSVNKYYRSLKQGNIFTGVCQSFCPQGGGSLYDVTSCLTTWSHVLPGKGVSVPWSHIPSGRSLCLVPCSFQGCPSMGVSLQGSLWRGSRSRGLCPGVSVQRRSLSRRGLCPGASLSGRPPGQRPSTYSDERVVRILECFLVSSVTSFNL